MILLNNLLSCKEITAGLHVISAVKAFFRPSEPVKNSFTSFFQQRHMGGGKGGACKADGA